MTSIQSRHEFPVRVCFVQPKAYPVLDPSDRSTFGGAEVSSATFAKGLAELPGYDVHFVVEREPRPSRQAGKIAVHFEKPRQRPDRGQSKTWNWQRLWQIPARRLNRLGRSIRKRLTRSGADVDPLYRRLNADVLCLFSDMLHAADRIRFLRRRPTKTVLFLMTDMDLSDRYSETYGIHDPDGHFQRKRDYALANADHIVAQSVQQRELLESRFGRTATVIFNPLDVRRKFTCREVDGRSGFALWIGRSDHMKRPDRCIELARRCPQVPFVMVMNKANETTHEEILRTAPENVTIVHNVPEIERYHAAASLLLNTSKMEGVPYVFLEAAKYGLPIVSLTVDPDQMLSQHGCGVVAGGDLKKMAELVARLHRGGPAYDSLAAAGPEYVRRHFDARDRVGELDALIRQLCGSGNRCQRAA